MFGYIIICGAVEGARFFDDEREALAAALAQSAIDGLTWEVRWTFIPEM